MSYSWSYSAYSTALSCLRKYKYAFIDKIVPEGPDSGDLVFGSALHSAINGCLTNQDGAAIFEMYWMSYKDKEVEYGRFKWKELAELGANFIRKFEKGHRSRYDLEFAEQRLYASYKGTRLEGTLDYYGDYDGRKALRDFKTSGRNYDIAKQDCALQLFLYSYLWLQNNPESKIETLGYTVFNKGTGSIQDLTWEFSEDKMYEALEGLKGYTSLIGNREEGDTRSHDYPMNLNACLDYNRKCPYYEKCHGKKENV